MLVFHSKKKCDNCFKKDKKGRRGGEKEVGKKKGKVMLHKEKKWIPRKKHF